jgi:hypothetical protein
LEKSTPTKAIARKADFIMNRYCCYAKKQMPNLPQEGLSPECGDENKNLSPPHLPSPWLL